MSVTINIDLPEDLLGILRSSPENFVGEMRLAAAVKWYEMGRISQGKAAELAGLSRAEFIDALGRYGVSPFQVSPEDLERECWTSLSFEGDELAALGQKRAI